MRPMGRVMGLLFCAFVLPVQAEETPPAVVPFQAGETIAYSIKKFGVKAGTATVKFAGEVELKGQMVYWVVFTGRGLNFFDEEKIYMDKNSFYPIMVKRVLNIWGKQEEITEEYDFVKRSVRITKNAGGQTTEQIIEQKEPLDNIYCFIFRYRQQGHFRIGDSFVINLPTMAVAIKLVKIAKLKVDGKDYETYYMKSDSGQYQIWFDKGSQKIPLRIHGAVGFGDTAMVMTEYKE